jgi:hypothetical protein
MYIYKYHKFGSAGEIHYDTLGEAIRHALNDMETGDASPVEILNPKHELVHDLDSITTLWETHIQLDQGD